MAWGIHVYRLCLFACRQKLLQRGFPDVLVDIGCDVGIALADALGFFSTFLCASGIVLFLVVSYCHHPLTNLKE